MFSRRWPLRGSGCAATPSREVLFVGTQRGMEMKLVPEAGLPLETIRSAGLEGHGRRCAWRKILRSLAPAFWDSRGDPAPAPLRCRVRRRRLCRRAGDAGGRHAGIAQRDLRAQRRARLHQSRPGQHAPRASPLAIPPWPSAWARNAVFTGCPVRPEFFAIAAAPARAALFAFLITGGSQGALGDQPRRFGCAADLLAAQKERLSHRAPDRRARL